MAFQSRDLILDHELAFFQPSELHFIDVQIELQTMNDVVQIAMFDAQFPQAFQAPESLGIDFGLLVVAHGSLLAVEEPHHRG
jgi:hypothetical protein